MMVFMDWGTSNLRAWLVDDVGAVRQRYASDQGLRLAADAGFGVVFDEVIKALQAPPDAPTLIFGMAGSKNGWVEVPYAPTPADASSIASCARPVPDRANAWIVGGVSHQLDGPRPEVMRGEEVQTLGVLQLQPDAQWVCMPGTHTKWARIEAGRLASFSTFMTGELFSWVTQQSILSTQISSDAFDRDGFAMGLGLAEEPGALTGSLFQLRTRFLAGKLAAQQVYSAASGLLIGHELASIRSQITGRVVMCAERRLADAYQSACAHHGLESTSVSPEDAAIAGLRLLAPQIIEGPHAGY